MTRSSRVCARIAVLTVLLACASDVAEPPPPRAVLPAAAMTIDVDVDTTSFVLHNSGGTAFSWTATPQQAWLALDPLAGTLIAGDSTRIIVRADKEPLPLGVTQGGVRIATNTFAQPQSLDVVVHVPPAPTVSFMYFDSVFVHPERYHLYKLTAGGKGVLDYTLSSDADFITPDVDGNSLDGSSWVHSFEIGAWPERDIVAHIIVTSNAADSPLRIPFLIRGLPAPEYTTLPDSVTDVAFAGGPVLLHAQALSTVRGGVLRTMSLPAPARGMAANGEVAVVAHANAVSFIDLTSMAVTATVPTGVAPRDIAWFAAGVHSGALVIPADASVATVLHIRADDHRVIEVADSSRPPLLAFAENSFTAAIYESGVATIDRSTTPRFAGWTDAEFAAGDFRAWATSWHLVTSAGAILESPPYQWLPTGARLAWPEGDDLPRIRWIHVGEASGWPVYHVIADEGDAPGSRIHRIGHESAMVIELPDVQVNGSMLEVEAEAVWDLGSQLVILQRAIGGSGGDVWMIAEMAR